MYVNSSSYSVRATWLFLDVCSKHMHIVATARTSYFFKSELEHPTYNVQATKGDNKRPKRPTLRSCLEQRNNSELAFHSDIVLSLLVINIDIIRIDIPQLV